MNRTPSTRALRVLAQFLVAGGLVRAVDAWVVDLDRAWQLTVLAATQLAIAYAQAWLEDQDKRRRSASRGRTRAPSKPSRRARNELDSKPAADWPTSMLAGILQRRVERLHRLCARRPRAHLRGSAFAGWGHPARTDDMTAPNAGMGRPLRRSR